MALKIKYRQNISPFIAEIVIGTNENETYSREDCKLSGWPELVVKKSNQ